MNGRDTPFEDEAVRQRSFAQAKRIEMGKENTTIIDGADKHEAILSRVEGALHATRAAIEEGIVPGGGVAVLRATSAVAGLKGINHDQDAAITIVQNAGDEPSVVVNKVLDGKASYGYLALALGLPVLFNHPRENQT